MKKILIIAFFLFFSSSCRYFKGDECNNTLPLAGVYENTYDENAKNILIIKKDGTFEQVFTKNGISKKNLGSWKKSIKPCNIYLKGLKLLHEIPENYKIFFKEKGVHRLNKIMFNEDLRKVFNYKRIYD